MKHAFILLIVALLACNAAPINDSKTPNPEVIRSVQEVAEVSNWGTSKQDSLKSELRFTTTESYAASKLKIAQDKASLNNADTETLNALFVDRLLNAIIPHWYGTPWTFEGHTAKPNQGEIACGYFVSTTLKHMGLKLNRYRMAQQSAWSEARTIGGMGIELLYPEPSSLGDLSFCEAMHDGLYLVGLANHVGYFLWKAGEGYFIHSDYVSGKVTFENARYAEAFRSDVYCFAPITGNAKLMEQWRNEEEVVVVMD